jgi:eukaryotic-like serine/threonine-protein kinase
LSYQETESGDLASSTDPDGTFAGDGPTTVDTMRTRDLPDELLAPAAVVGRYIVLRTLGSGGAGVVYAAYDPDLDRTIALKVVRRELADRVEVRARFLREAQALARLSHPNVITVYDVGSIDGRTFIAMEYIHGQTFADWVATSEPNWSRVLTLLLKAGRGLAAAHAAGLIHRDFKPANLLVGANGRVVVTDFGLARALKADGGVHPLASRADGLCRSSAFAESITRTGVVQGTPAYMAPEQRQGKPADAQADQFSFCVTLYEGLFREHPFLRPPSPFSSTVAGTVGSGAEQQLWAKTVAHGPRDVRGVPMWLLRTVQRGLSWRPEDRYPSMDSLLIALKEEPVQRRRQLQLGLAMVVAVVGGGFAGGFVLAGDPEERICTGARGLVSGTWNPTVADQVRAAFVATGRPNARLSADRVAVQLDAYTAQWTDMHRSACLATARGEQSLDLLERRMLCLRDRLMQVRARLDLFVRADGQLVDQAIERVAELEPPLRCGDSGAGFSLPAGPGRPARVSQLEHPIDRAGLQRKPGRSPAVADAALGPIDQPGKVAVGADVEREKSRSGHRRWRRKGRSDSRLDVRKAPGGLRHRSAAASAFVERQGFAHGGFQAALRHLHRRSGYGTQDARARDRALRW